MVVALLERLNLMVDNKTLDQIKKTTVLIVGLGGVGGYAFESIVRSGINKIIIADNDIIDKTNLNRQLLSLESNIGSFKVDVAKKRALDINPNVQITQVKEFITIDNLELLFKEKVDYIIDACDTIKTKWELIKYAKLNDIAIISCMGMGNRFDPTKIKITELQKTSYDAIARILRKKLKNSGIKDKVMVISSCEEPVKIKGKIGSNAFVPAVAGLLCTSYIINDIRSKNESNFGKTDW